jgi:iron complex outermembrane receptor protein
MNIRTVFFLLMTLQAVLAGTASAQSLARNLLDHTLEELSSITVTSVSGRAQSLSTAASSVYVISGQDIRRSGARSIPEALQLAPNLQVARTGANNYAITARGFNATASNRLVVLLDGRSIYTPVFSGVFWDAQDTLLEDIQRIEVISGPGGVLWGANAVNGVINIVTRNSADTQGTMVSADSGGGRSSAAARVGGRFEGGSYRIYAKSVRQDDLRNAADTSLRDGNDRLQAGFRADLAKGVDRFTLQGDVYGAEGHAQPQANLGGMNLLGRWQREWSDGASLRVQAYADHARRQNLIESSVDVEFSHALAARGAHRFIWGAGVRRSRNEVTVTATSAFFPVEKELSSANVYMQDEIALGNTLEATIGAKVDRNSYTGAEFLPSARLAWRPAANKMVWAAWSRAVRAPSRFDRELFLPGRAPFILAGGPDFQSEISHVYELGYRAQPSARLSYSATAFYHDHHKVRTIRPATGGAVWANDSEGHTSGIEGWATLRVSDRWRLDGGYTHLISKFRLVPGGVDIGNANNNAADPRNWWKLRSALDLGNAWQLDVMARHYGGLTPNRPVNSYDAVDVRLAWMPARGVELSFAVQNLFDDKHIEWSPPGAELRRTGMLRLRLDL